MSEYKTSQEFFAKGYAKLKPKFTSGEHVEVINETMEIINDLHDNFMTLSIDELTSIAGRLALLKAYLGEISSYENLKTNNAYIYKKFARANKRTKATERLNFDNIKITQDSIEAEVIKMTVDEEQEWAFHQYYTDKVTNLFDSIVWILTTINWRIKEKRSDQYTAKLYDGADTSEIL